MPQLDKKEVLDKCVQNLEQTIQSAANIHRAMGSIEKANQISNSWFAIKKELEDKL